MQQNPSTFTSAHQTGKEVVRTMVTFSVVNTNCKNMLIINDSTAMRKNKS